MRGIKPNLQTDLFAIENPEGYTGQGLEPDPDLPPSAEPAKKKGFLGKLGMLH